MDVIKIKGEVGSIKFVPGRISSSHILKIERELKRLVKTKEDYLTAPDMRAILKAKDPLLGTPGGILRAYRSREELTQQDLAKKCSMKQSHISEIEKNKRDIGVKVAKKLAHVLQCDYRRLL